MGTRSLTAVAALAVVSLSASGCGGSSKKANTQTTAPSAQQSTASAQQPGASTKVTIKMGEFFFKPGTLTVHAGKVTITAPNIGHVEHELVLLQTNTDPSKLKTEADGEANEDAYSGPGEIPDVEAGSTKSVTLTLKPGTYAMICNVPGHYKAGMYGRITVQ